MPTDRKIKAFTIIELLLTMTLTGILVVFAFMGYNQIQKLFVNYTVQSKFISDYNQLTRALFVISDKTQTIESEGEKKIIFRSDSTTVICDLENEEKILLKFTSHTDTFYLPHKKTEINYLNINAETPSNLIGSFACEVFFKNQKFRVSFRKDYDATTKLNSSLTLLPSDEQY